jgi:hypothetical protein
MLKEYSSMKSIHNADQQKNKKNKWLRIEKRRAEMVYNQNPLIYFL